MRRKHMHKGHLSNALIRLLNVGTRLNWSGPVRVSPTLPGKRVQGVRAVPCCYLDAVAIDQTDGSQS